jgi:hypothetical protein
LNKIFNIQSITGICCKRTEVKAPNLINTCTLGASKKKHRQLRTHMTMRIFIMLTYIFILVGCHIPKWNYFYPYTTVNPEKFYKNLPNNYNDCLNQLDSILKPEGKNYFKQLETEIAVIEISNDIGRLFANHWNMGFYGEPIRSMEYRFQREKKCPQFVNDFIKSGVSDPELMVRVLFTCFHKKLNNVNFNWNDEIAMLKKNWKQPASILENGAFSGINRNRDDSLLNLNSLNIIQIADTVKCVNYTKQNFFSRQPDYYYLTGLVFKKDFIAQKITIKILDINTSERPNNIVLPDTLAKFAKDYKLLNKKYFNFHYNNYYNLN